MQSSDPTGVVPNEDLTAEDASALGWAVSTGHAVAMAIVDRVRGGGSGVTVDELALVREAWSAAGRPAPHRHVHRTRVALVDGTEVIGVTFAADDPYTREEQPAFGLYLDDTWRAPWPHGHVEWPDFGVPTDLEHLRRSLADVLARARSGEAVEIGCLGGHGRTGTALACLAVLAGTPPDDAVAWVRATYCEKAVETDAQEQLVADFRP